MFPEDLDYTSEHEWVRHDSDSDVARIGITDYAQSQLGDIVYVSVPEVGAEVRAGDPVGELESTKSVSDLYAPVSGTVRQVNEALTDTPELINSDPYGEGWIMDVAPSDPSEFDSLLKAEEYRSATES